MLLLGKEESENKTLENYQLLIGCNYIGYKYEHNNNESQREEFYDVLSKRFAEKIIDKGSGGLMGVVNGMKINPETKKHEKIQKLERNLAEQFSEKITNALKRSPKAMTVSYKNSRN